MAVDLFVVHGVMMILAWGLFAQAGMLVAVMISLQTHKLTGYFKASPVR